MSSISAVAGGAASLATQVNQAASHAAKRVDHDGDHDGNKPEAAVETARSAGASVKKLDMKV